MREIIFSVKCRGTATGRCSGYQEYLFLYERNYEINKPGENTGLFYVLYRCLDTYQVWWYTCKKMLRTAKDYVKKTAQVWENDSYAVRGRK